MMKISALPSWNVHFNRRDTQSGSSEKEAKIGHIRDLLAGDNSRDWKRLGLLGMCCRSDSCDGRGKDGRLSRKLLRLKCRLRRF